MTIRFLQALLFISIASAVPTTAQAAFNFGLIDSSHYYYEENTPSGQPVVTSTGPSGYQRVYGTWLRQTGTNTWESVSFGEVCRATAEQNGLNDAQPYWCIPGGHEAYSFSGGCILLCQQGAAGWVYPFGTGQANDQNRGEPVQIFSVQPQGFRNVLDWVITVGTTTYSFPLNYPDSDKHAICQAYNVAFITFPSGGCELWRHEATAVPQAPVAALSANPSTVASGNASALTWSCAGQTTSASIDQGIGALSATGDTWSGTRSTGALTSNKTYTLTCTGPGGTSTASTTVTVSAGITATCSVSPTSISAGGTATWTATASGGSGSYAYSWSGTDGLTGITASVAKQYSLPGTKSASVQVTSGTQNITVACSNTLTVTPANLPDLTAGSVTPVKAFAARARSFQASIYNEGTLSVSTSFTNLLQRADSASGAGAQDIRTATMGSLAVDANALTSFATYAFSASDAGSVKYLRACADKNSASGSGTVSELSDGNNCGPWTAIQVLGLCTPKPTCDCSDPDDPDCDSGNDSLSCSYDDANNDGTIDINEAVTFTASPGTLGVYTWDPSNAAPYTDDEQTTRSFASIGSYHMRVSDPDGEYDSDTCEFSVGTESGCSAQDVVISANPTRVQKGTRSNITYEIPGVATSGMVCTLSSSAGSIEGFPKSITVNSCSTGIPETTIPTHPIQSQTTFTIKCGTKEDSVVINVFPEIDEF